MPHARIVTMAKENKHQVPGRMEGGSDHLRTVRTLTRGRKQPAGPKSVGARFVALNMIGNDAGGPAHWLEGKMGPVVTNL